jgi:uncharacterized protein (TIGR02996 family)
MPAPRARPPPVDLEPFRALWERTRSPEVAEAFLRLEATAAPRPFKGTRAEWVKRAQNADLLARGPLIRALEGPTQAETEKRLDQLGRWPPDPRAALALRALLDALPWASDGARSVWRKVFEQLDRHGDARAFADPAALTSRFKVNARLGAWLAEQWAAALRRQPKAAVLSARERASLAAIAPATVRRSDAELLARVWAEPDADEPRQVLADLWSEQGLPRGELLALQLSADPAAHQARIDTLVRKHGAEWLGPIEPVLVKAGMTFRRGFVAEARVRFRNEGDVERHGHHPAWATLERLEWAYPSVVKAGTERWVQWVPPSARSLREVSALREAGLENLLAGGPWPRLERIRCAAPPELVERLLASDRLPALREVEAHGRGRMRVRTR